MLASKAFDPMMPSNYFVLRTFAPGIIIIKADKGILSGLLCLLLLIIFLIISCINIHCQMPIPHNNHKVYSCPCMLYVQPAVILSENRDCSGTCSLPRLCHRSPSDKEFHHYNKSRDPYNKQKIFPGGREHPAPLYSVRPQYRRD